MSGALTISAHGPAVAATAPLGERGTGSGEPAPRSPFGGGDDLEVGEARALDLEVERPTGLARPPVEQPRRQRVAHPAEAVDQVLVDELGGHERGIDDD